MSIFSLLAARSISIFETPGVREPLLERVAQLQVLVQQLRVVLVGIPARAPRLVEAEPEPVRMNFLTHNSPSLPGWQLVSCQPSAVSCSLPPARSARPDSSARAHPPWPPCFGLAPRGRLGPDAVRDRRRPLGHLDSQVRGALDDAEGAAHRRRADALLRRTLVGVAGVDHQPLDVAAEAVLLLRVGNRRPQHLLDVAGHRLARERSVASAALTSRPRIRSSTSPAFCADVRTYFAVACA